MQEDQKWLQQLQRGEPEGLHRIYDRYKDDLVTIAAGLLVDRASAEDCLHDVSSTWPATPPASACRAP